MKHEKRREIEWKMKCWSLFFALLFGCTCTIFRSNRFFFVERKKKMPNFSLGYLFLLFRFDAEIFVFFSFHCSHYLKWEVGPFSSLKRYSWTMMKYSKIFGQLFGSYKDFVFFKEFSSNICCWWKTDFLPSLKNVWFLAEKFKTKEDRSQDL